MNNTANHVPEPSWVEEPYGMTINPNPKRPSIALNAFFAIVGFALALSGSFAWIGRHKHSGVPRTAGEAFAEFAALCIVLLAILAIIASLPDGL